MVTLKGQQIYLRALEAEDLGFIYNIENETNLWHLSETQTPYSKFVIEKYLKNAHQDIYEAKQLRLAICLLDGTTIGLIDLFNFNAKHKRAGIGIVIKDKLNRAKGFGKDALQVLINYASSALHVHQLYADISEDNLQSLKLFESCNFKIVGLKEDWRFNGKSYSNVYLLQHIIKE